MNNKDIVNFLKKKNMAFYQMGIMNYSFMFTIDDNMKIYLN